MPYIAKPTNRSQVTGNTLDSMAEWNSTARVIDHFADCLDLHKLGFEKQSWDLRADHCTAAGFRKGSINSLNGVFKKFTKKITVDLETGFVSIDDSKFKAWNSKDRNLVIMKLDDRIE